MSLLKLNSSNENLYKSKPYLYVKSMIVLSLILLGFVYMFRDNCYDIKNFYLTLFVGTAPNLIGSLLFTLVAIFYIVPILFSWNTIKKPFIVWFINIINIMFFGLIEHLHVVFKLGIWDNYDMAATFIGVLLATFAYYCLMFKGRGYSHE